MSVKVNALRLYRELKSYAKVAKEMGVHLNTARQRVIAGKLIEYEMKKWREDDNTN